jgi:peptide/nickel transport system permease protein
MALPPLDVLQTGAPDAVRARGERPSGPSLSPRVSFLLRRLGRMVVALALVVVATFAVIHLVPGDPVRAVLGPSAPAELVARIRSELGLDLPLPTQFLNYVTGLFTGDLGVSLQTHRPVADTIATRLPATIALAVGAFVVAALGALPIGIATAISTRGGRRRILDVVVSAVIGVLIVIPNFLLAVGLIALFSIGLGLLPAAGWGDLQNAVLPVLALAIGPMAYLARIVHVEMLTVLDATYITTARSKRLPAHLIYLRHALPNMLTSALTIGGLMLTGLVAGTVLIETIFAIPGLGMTIVSSISAKDYPMIQGVVLVYALMVLGVTLLVDLVLMAVDPRSSIAEG